MKDKKYFQFEIRVQKLRHAYWACQKNSKSTLKIENICSAHNPVQAAAPRKNVLIL